MENIEINTIVTYGCRVQVLLVWITVQLKAYRISADDDLPQTHTASPGACHWPEPSPPPSGFCDRQAYERSFAINSFHIHVCITAVYGSLSSCCLFSYFALENIFLCQCIARAVSITWNIFNIIDIFLDKASCRISCPALQLKAALNSWSPPTPSQLLGLQAGSPPGNDPSSFLFGYSYRMSPESLCLLLGEKLAPSIVAGWSPSR